MKDCIVLASGTTVQKDSQTAKESADLQTIFDRVITELVSKMREMKMDKTELGCLR